MSLSLPQTAIAATPARMSLITRLSHMVALQRSRSALKALSADQLTDLGLSEAEAAQEAARPFWDAPANWRA